MIKKNESLYPIPSGSGTAYTGTASVYPRGIITTYENAHITWEMTYLNYSPTADAYMIAYPISANGTNSKSSNINRTTDPIFTIPAGSEVTIKLKNMTATYKDDTDKSRKRILALRNVSTDVGITTGQLDENDTEIEKTFTVDSDKDVSCIYIRIGAGVLT